MLLSPWLIGFLVFAALPMALSLYYSFTHYDITRPPSWVGLDNYRYMLGIGRRGDANYWIAVRNTLWIIAVGIPLRLVFSIATAMLLVRPRRGTNAYRTLFFMPSMAPAVGAALVFVYLFNPATGPINQALERVLPGVDPPLWFYDPAWSKPALIVLGLWGIGDAIVLYLAGLINIPRQLYEAIDLEGAGHWQRFRHVTLPMLTPVILFTTIIGVITGLQYFDQAYVATYAAGGSQATAGSPQGSLLFYSTWIYENAFVSFHMGYASALAWVLFVITMALTALLLLTSRRWVHYGGGLS